MQLDAHSVTAIVFCLLISILLHVLLWILVKLSWSCHLDIFLECRWCFSRMRQYMHHIVVKFQTPSFNTFRNMIFFSSMNFGPVTPYRQKVAHMSPPCISTGGLKKATFAHFSYVGKPITCLPCCLDRQSCLHDNHMHLGQKTFSKIPLI